MYLHSFSVLYMHTYIYLPSFSISTYLLSIFLLSLFRTDVGGQLCLAGDPMQLGPVVHTYIHTYIYSTYTLSLFRTGAGGQLCLAGQE